MLQQARGKREYIAGAGAGVKAPRDEPRAGAQGKRESARLYRAGLRMHTTESGRGPSWYHLGAI